MIYLCIITNTLFNNNLFIGYQFIYICIHKMPSTLRLLLKYLIDNFGGHKIAINESGDTTW